MHSSRWLALSISKNYVFDGTSNYRLAIAHGRFLSMRPRCVHHSLSVHTHNTYIIRCRITRGPNLIRSANHRVDVVVVRLKKAIEFNKQGAFETPGTPILILYRYTLCYSFLQSRAAASSRESRFLLYSVKFIVWFFRNLEKRQYFLAKILWRRQLAKFTD